jgi:hypothetical protein
VRRFLILVALIGVLVGFVFLNRAFANWHYVMPAEPGALLYVATFDAFNDDWGQYAGRISSQVADGALRLSVGEPVAGPYSVASPHFGDFDVRAEATAVEGPENNGFGIVFREQDPNNFYTFLISSDGYYRVVRSLSGEEKELSTWIETPHVNSGIGAENSLRVVGSGDQFEFYANDQLLSLCIPDDPNARSTWNFVNQTCVDGSMQDTLIDASFPTGRLGVVATTIQGSEMGVVVDFDNVLVFGPEAVD